MNTTVNSFYLFIEGPRSIGPGSVVGITTTLQAGRSGVRIPVGGRFFAAVQTGPGAHPASYTMSTRNISWEVKAADA